MSLRPVALFDFDGTLTIRDSFTEFLRWRAGPGAWALGLVSAVAIPGQIALGGLSDRIGREWIWTISSFGFAICFAMLITLQYTPTLLLVYVMVVAQGALGYGFTSIMGAVFFTLLLLTGNTMAQAVRERIPVLLAALGQKNVALAAEVAEGWQPIFFLPEKAKDVWGDAVAALTLRGCGSSGTDAASSPPSQRRRGSGRHGIRHWSRRRRMRRGRC